MRRKSKDLKILALTALRGNYIIPILASFTISILTSLCTTVASSLFGGSSLFSTIASNLFGFIITLIFSVFTAGLYLIFLNIARRKPYSFGNLTALFKQKPDRIIIAGFFLALINLAASLPYYIYLYRLPQQLTVEQLSLHLVPLFLLLELGTLAAFFLTLPLCQVYFLLVDHPDMEAMEAFRQSIRLMKGNKGRYFLLNLSFLPLILLSVLTCGIALIWITPYMQMAETMFYLDLTGELDVPSQPDASRQGMFPGNDYNSEA